MFDRQVTPFIGYCKVSGFKDKSIESLSINLNKFKIFLGKILFSLTSSWYTVLFNELIKNQRLMRRKARAGDESRDLIPLFTEN